MKRLAAALAASLIVHLLVLKWTVPLSTGERSGLAGSTAPELRARLRSIAVANGESQRPDLTSVIAAPSAPSKSAAEPPAVATAPPRPPSESEGGIALIG